jgi:hypothetical protein
MTAPNGRTKLERAEEIISLLRSYLAGTRIDIDGCVTERLASLVEAYDADPNLVVESLPPRRRAALVEIVGRYSASGASPTIRALAPSLGVSSSTVAEQVGRLRADGWLRDDVPKQGGLAIVPTSLAERLVLASREFNVDG